MNLFSYIDKYGDYSFDEVEFNEVDNIIFSSLAYVSLGKYVSRGSFCKRTIKEVGDAYFTNYDKKKKRILAVKNGIKVLRCIKDTKRYRNLLLYNYVYKGDNDEQFCALTIEINKKLVYVSFEGTDQLISGWKEDFMFAYKFPVLSQKRAISYVNKYFLFNNKKMILGGHSKGGNLAIASGMYANGVIRNRIVNIYNNDGPGFKKEEINSLNYKRIRDKIIRIIPNYSFFGLILNHDDRCVVVKSFRRGFIAHCLDNWVVDDRLLKRDKLSDFSYHLNKGMMRWVNKYSYSEREKFVNALFLIFDKANVTSVVDIMNNKKLILSLIREYNDADKTVKVMMLDLFRVGFNYIKEHNKAEIEDMFENKNKERFC